MATAVRFEAEFAGEDGVDASSVFRHAMLAHYRGSGPRICLFIPCAASGDQHQMEMEMDDGVIVTVQMDLTMLRAVFCRRDLVSVHVRVVDVSELESTTSLAQFYARVNPDLDCFQLYPAMASTGASTDMPLVKEALLKLLGALDEKKPKRQRLAKTARGRAAQHVQYPWCCARGFGEET